MQVPGNMTTPRLKLDAGEEILETREGLRKKGLFGNRFGELYVTNRRVAFVKAIMKSGVLSAAMDAKGVRPMLSFPLADIRSVERVPQKKLVHLVVSDGARSEKFTLAPEAVDGVIARIKAAQG
ncbi:MAG: hypothetical protein EP329_14270 [Deltaproteobacteria bacterium]|nr:MAG: hypothetical protein EP329_14270 [Deltaproteobacteria bacterium]